MDKEKINEFVKKIEPYFLGYTAHENCLKNSNGMELVFRCDWKNKTTVSGLHAKHRHSIGCSFEKPVEKIFKDIRRRLMPDYHADFFKTKKDKIESAEAEELEKQKLRALASVVGGEISCNYGHKHAGSTEYVSANNFSIYQSYNGRYDFHLELSYIDTMKIVQLLKESFFIKSALNMDS